VGVGDGEHAGFGRLVEAVGVVLFVHVGRGEAVGAGAGALVDAACGVGAPGCGG